MANVMIVDQNQMEKKELLQYLKDAVAYFSDDHLKMIDCQLVEEAIQSLKYDKQLDMAILEILGNAQLEYSKTLREEYDVLNLMLIADATISPMSYLNPKIRPSSLLLRPHTKDIAYQTIKEFIMDYYYRNQSEEASLVIENRNGKTIIPYSQIYYIEVREKKLYIRLQNKEYTKYDSLNNILTDLPDHFIRCHRSFLFNKHYLVNVKLSENIIYLEHDITVPLSRSYKKEIKEILNGK